MSRIHPWRVLLRRHVGPTYGRNTITILTERPGRLLNILLGGNHKRDRKSCTNTAAPRSRGNSFYKPAGGIFAGRSDAGKERQRMLHKA